MYIETVVVIKIIKIAIRDGTPTADVGELFGWTSHRVSGGVGQGARWKNEYKTSKRRDDGDASVSAHDKQRVKRVQYKKAPEGQQGGEFDHRSGLAVQGAGYDVCSAAAIGVRLVALAWKARSGRGDMGAAGKGRRLSRQGSGSERWESEGDDATLLVHSADTQDLVDMAEPLFQLDLGDLKIPNMIRCWNKLLSVSKNKTVAKSTNLSQAKKPCLISDRLVGRVGAAYGTVRRGLEVTVLLVAIIIAARGFPARGAGACGRSDASESESERGTTAPVMHRLPKKIQAGKKSPGRIWLIVQKGKDGTHVTHQYKGCRKRWRDRKAQSERERWPIQPMQLNKQWMLDVCEIWGDVGGATSECSSTLGMTTVQPAHSRSQEEQSGNDETTVEVILSEGQATMPQHQKHIQMVPFQMPTNSNTKKGQDLASFMSSYPESFPELCPLVQKNLKIGRRQPSSHRSKTNASIQRQRNNFFKPGGAFELGQAKIKRLTELIHTGKPYPSDFDHFSRNGAHVRKVMAEKYPPVTQLPPVTIDDRKALLIKSNDPTEEQLALMGPGQAPGWLFRTAAGAERDIIP
ncbi:hypothetical protein B0H14DRAFT_2654592 [Mycena olivaceomarginata]|nr:hypothetical protein B0H14DRAFT_2654592 [Mycena olivaceomarginata]